MRHINIKRTFSLTDFFYLIPFDMLNLYLHPHLGTNNKEIKYKS